MTSQAATLPATTMAQAPMQSAPVQSTMTEPPRPEPRNKQIKKFFCDFGECKLSFESVEELR